jgi:hypothetical protein
MPAARGLRELYFYWHTADAALGDRAQAEVAAVQSEWQARWPGLVARLLQRAEGPRVTWMEVYTRPGGIDSNLQDALVAEGDERLTPWIDGRRHLEVFEPVTAAAPTATPVAPVAPIKPGASIGLARPATRPTP